MNEIENLKKQISELQKELESIKKVRPIKIKMMSFKEICTPEYIIDNLKYETYLNELEDLAYPHTYINLRNIQLEFATKIRECITTKDDIMINVLDKNVNRNIQNALKFNYVKLRKLFIDTALANGYVKKTLNSSIKLKDAVNIDQVLLVSKDDFFGDKKFYVGMNYYAFKHSEVVYIKFKSEKSEGDK